MPYASKLQRVSKSVLYLIGFFALSSRVEASEFAGGSNYGWYEIASCERDSYAVIPNIETAQATIKDQLISMYSGGQRRLRIPLFMSSEGLNGYLRINNNGLATKSKKDVVAFLSLVHDIGFDEVLLSMFPQGKNYAGNATFDEASYTENLMTIMDIRSAAKEVGIPYLIDLQNEAIPAPNQPSMLSYTKRLWADYVHRFGVDDTVGFSLIPDQSRLPSLEAVYNGVYPRVMDIHLYGDAFSNGVRVFSFVKSKAPDTSVIVGETFYDDQAELIDIDRAAAVTNTKLLFVLQWPVGRTSRCPDVDVIPLRAPATLITPSAASKH